MNDYELQFKFQIRQLKNGSFQVTVICTGFHSSLEAENYVNTWNTLVSLFPWEDNPTVH